jgi:hypothetical protein
MSVRIKLPDLPLGQPVVVMRQGHLFHCITMLVSRLIKEAQDLRFLIVGDAI